MKAQYIPNLISLVRIMLVVPVAVCLLNGDYQTALILFLVAGLSDGLDGYLARRYHWTSHLGGILDPMGDKLLMVSSYLVLGWLEQLPLWLVATVIGRDGVIVFGTLLYRLLIADIVFKPLLISKINTVFQLLLVVLVIVSLAYMPVAGSIIQPLIVIVFITTLISGVSYIVLWGQRAWMSRSMRESHD